MARKIKIWNDPFGLGHGLCAKKYITFKPGVTILVGCNGIGKSTMLHNIKTALKEQHIAYIEFDNLTDGGLQARSLAGFNDDIVFVMESALSSEGENIMMNIAKMANKIGNYIRNHPDNKELWILFDAIDSGLSIDNITDVKEYLFKIILNDPGNAFRDIYIIASANEYELANGERCLDVYNGKFIKFKNYPRFRQFILDSKKWKNERAKVLACDTNSISDLSFKRDID